jgi:hypothetical protein
MRDEGKSRRRCAKTVRFPNPGEVTANRSKVSGVYVETFASGDKIFYDYQNKAKLKDGAPQAGQGSTRWQAVPEK